MQSSFDFLSNGGEMGALMRQRDWTSTLGPTDDWPEILKTSLRLVLTSHHPMFIWWGPELIQFYNDAYRQTMGPERHPSALGQPGRECWAEIWPIIGPQIESVMAGGPATWHEDQLVPLTRYGQRENVWWTYGYSPIQDAQGVRGVLVVCNDVSAQHLSRQKERELNQRLMEEIHRREKVERHLAVQLKLSEELKEQRLQAAEALASQRDAEITRLRSLFQQAPGFVAVLQGPTHVFEFCNAAYLRLVGERDLLGLPVREALPEVEGQGFFEKLDEVFATARPFLASDAALMVQRQPGAPAVQVYLDFVYQPIIDADGVVTGVFVEGFDATERRRAEEGLREADRRKDEFLAMLAHELRNPLAPIGMAAQILSISSADEGRVRQTSQIIKRQVDHMTSLINDMLDVSRVTSGLVTLDTQPLDIKQVIAESIEQTQPLIESRRHRLALDSCAEPAVVFGDGKRLVQVVTNLLQNAAKYTHEGGFISIRVEQYNDEVVISVSDNGIGIDGALLPHVFELFAQGERSSERSQGGLGLGLALVKTLISLHGGQVHAASEGSGKGATFTVRLPRFAGPSETSSERDSPMGMPGDGGKSLQVLVVDDNVDAAMTMAMFLQAGGYRTLVEHEPMAALERAHSERPQVIVLDIGLPGMDGNELARKLRADPGTAGSRLIAVTGYGQEYDREQSLAAGFDDFFVKPVDTRRLIELLETLSLGRR